MSNNPNLMLTPYLSIIQLDKKTYLLKNKKIVSIEKQTFKSLNKNLKKHTSNKNLIDYLVKHKFLQEKKQIKVKKSSGLTIAVTSKCNLGCLYCYADANKNPKTITKEIYETSINNFLGEIFLSSKKADLILHGGGEPTLNAQLFIDIIEYFKNKCEHFMLIPNITFITNGTFNQKIRDFIKTTKEIKTISFSLDGIEEVQNKQRPFVGGKSSFSTIIKNLEFLKNLDIKVTLMSVVTKNSVDYILDTVRLAKKYNVSGVKFDPMYDSPRSLSKGLNEVTLKEFTKNLFEAYKLGIKLGVNVTSSFITIFRDPTNQACGTVNAMPVITPEGNITSCYEVLEEKDPAFNTFKLGKVQEGKNIMFKEKVDFITSRTSDNISECESCFLKYTCAGGCSVQSFRKKNDIFSVLEAECEAKRELNKNIIEYIYENKELFKDEFEIKEFL